MSDIRRISVDLPAELVNALDTAAEERIVGRTKLIEFLLRDGLDHLVPIEHIGRRHSDRTEETS